MTPAEAKAKADRFPVELRPHPGYEYEPPREVLIRGRRCVEFDAGVLPWAADIATQGQKQGFPKGRR